MDNGVFNEFIQKTDSDEAGETPKESISSIKRTEDSKMNMIFETEEDEETDSQASDRVNFDDNLYRVMEMLGFERQYLKDLLMQNLHTYGTAGIHLLQKYYDKGN